MKLMAMYFIIVFLFFFSFSSYSDDTTVMVEKFYMSDPNGCITAVNAYFKQNQDSVDKIKKITSEAMGKFGSMMSGMSGLDSGQIENMAQGLDQSNIPKESPDTDRFNKAIEEFTQKHPQAGMQLAMKLMELVPMFDTDQFKDLLN